MTADLAAERSKATFDVRAMTYMLDGGKKVSGIIGLAVHMLIINHSSCCYFYFLEYDTMTTLTHVLPQRTEKKEALVKLLESDNVFRKHDRAHLTQTQHYDRVMAKYRRLLVYAEQHDIIMSKLKHRSLRLSTISTTRR